jgi:hypothetical protein
MKTHGGVYIGSRFLDLGTSWRLTVSFTPRPLYAEKEPPVVIREEVGWVGLRAGLDDMDK